MGDHYKHDFDGVSSVISVLKTKLKDYKNVVSELDNLIKTIDSSTDWKDMSVKTSFVSTCESYLVIYRNLINVMEKYINYLSSKSDAASALERAFSG